MSDTERSPDEIRQEIAARTERLAGSVEALSGKKTDVQYASSHPKEVLKEKTVEVVDRVKEKAQELKARASSPDHAGKQGGLAQKVARSVSGAVESVENKLDDILGVEFEDQPSEPPYPSAPSSATK